MSAPTLASGITLASTASAVALGALPDIVLVGEVIAIVTIRGLSAVAKALWEGARPELVDFGADAAASWLAALRRRLKMLPRR
jgi:hypothetical protein